MADANIYHIWIIFYEVVLEEPWIYCVPLDTLAKLLRVIPRDTMVPG